MEPRGKFIVIEGTDGSGKTVQFERLILALPESLKVGTLDFPRYGEPASYFVQKYLRGRYGGEVDPRAASIFYAVDRFDAKLKTLQWLEEGRLVIANRYVASNMAYQGAKMESKPEREKFYKWLYELEYKTLGIPKPDLSIILHVPAGISRDLIEKRGGRAGLKGGDIYEDDLEHQKRAEQVYLEIASLFPEDFRIIECAPQGSMLPEEKVHEMLLAAVQDVLKK